MRLVPKKNTYQFRARVWLYPGDAAWHFLTVPKKESEAMKKRYGAKKRGWGSIPVTVRIGGTEWDTSVFPDSKSGTYLLPLKAQVRRSEGLFEGETADVRIRVRL